MKNILTVVRQSSADLEAAREVRTIRLLAKAACIGLAGVAYLLGGPTVGFGVAVALIVLF